MSGHSVSAAHDETIVAVGGTRVRQLKRAPPARVCGNPAECIRCSRVTAVTANGARADLAGNDGDAEKLAHTQDVSTPSVAARTLGSTDSRSSDVIGSAGRGDNGIAEGPGQAVLLATKLHVPAVRRQLVHRAALLDALSAGNAQADAGQRASGLGQDDITRAMGPGCGGKPGVRLAIARSSDNDPVWFWMYVVAALQTVSPGLGHRAVGTPGHGRRPVQVVLPILLE